MYDLNNPSYLAVRELFAQGANQEVVSFAETLRAPLPPGVSFYVVAALINLEQPALARRYLAETFVTAVPEEQADLTALEGLLAARRGDADTYLAKATEANTLHVSAHTLYHLGTALADPDERLRLMQASLVEAEGTSDRYAEARAAGALASILVASGRLNEAAGWVAFSLDRTTHPGLRLSALNLQGLLRVYCGDTAGLEVALLSAYEESRGSDYLRQRTQVHTTLADLYQATGRSEEALAIYEEELRDAPRALRAWLVRGSVRALCALGREPEAVAQARATTVLVSELSEYHRQLAALALGVALWPADEAKEPLGAAFEHFRGEDLIAAAEAAFHLDALEPRPGLPTEMATVLDVIRPQLTAAGLRLLAGRTLSRQREQVGPPLKVFVLGKAEAYLRGELLPTRRRALELLALLLSRPAGYEAEALGEGLYGSVPGAALRVEIHRLRGELGLEVRSRPYRLVTPVWSDLTELGRLLGAGRVHEAVALYRGPLLPNSDAPGVAELRGWLEAELRGAVLATGDAEALWELAQVMPFDLELWEALARNLAEQDPRRGVAAGRSARVRLELGI